MVSRRHQPLTLDQVTLENVRHRRMAKDKCAFFERLFAAIDGIPGDIVEAGTYTGLGIAILYVAMKRAQQQRHIRGFDIWASGFPVHILTEQDQKDTGMKPSNRFSTMNREQALENIHERNHIPWAAVTLTRGMIADTLDRAPAPIALAVIDVDAYRSYQDALRILWPKVPVGGIVSFDEYHDHNWPGAKVAVDEFLEGRTDYVLMEDYRWFVRKTRSGKRRKTRKA